MCRRVFLCLWMAVMAWYPALVGAAASAAEPAPAVASASGRAFGRVLLEVDGKERTFGMLSGVSGELWVRSVRTERVQRMDLRGDGRFAWDLEPGEYVVAAFRVLGPPRTVRTWASFTVPPPGQAVYVGTLHVMFIGGRVGFHVEDDFDAAVAANRPWLDGQAWVAISGLMQPERRLGQARRIVDICHERWGLSCDTQWLGVRPTEPEGSRARQLPVATLTPRLAWTPSPRVGTSYDVALYESVTLVGGLGGLRTRGNLVSYAEDLMTPSYQVTEPLRPGRQYAWSVRLRDGDTVSTWSTSGYFVFFIVGWMSGSGDWFIFETGEAAAD